MRLLRLILLGVVLAGCAEAPPMIYPVTIGSHVPGREEKKYRIVVWATDSSIASTITSAALSNGHTVVERTRLQEVFKEQTIILTHTSDDDAQILRVGKLLGANTVIFAEHSISTRKVVSVSVRAVDVETGEIIFSGSAYFRVPIKHPDASLSYLTTWALRRASCRIESGYTWSEPNAHERGGCRTKDKE
jgi:hypothetical protein